MINENYNKTTLELLIMVKEHIAKDPGYTAMTLASEIENDCLSNRPGEETNVNYVKLYLNKKTVDELIDLGFKFQFYPYNTHYEKHGDATEEVTDTWALALTWYTWTPLKEIFRVHKI